MRWVKKVWNFVWGQVTEALDAGLITLFSVALYFWLMLSGSDYYARGVEFNLAIVKHLASNTPDMYGWNVGGMFRNIAIGQNAEKVLFYAEIALLVTIVYLAFKRALRQCRRLLRRGLHKDTDAPHEETRPQMINQPQQTEGEKIMLSFRDNVIVAVAAISALAVTIMVPATYLGLIPAILAFVNGIPVLAEPAYVRVVQVLVSFGILAFAIYAVSNTWSGLTKYASSALNRFDNGLSWLTWFSATGTLLAVIIMLLIQTENVRKVYEAVSSMQLLLAVVGFAWFDVFVIQRHKGWIMQTLSGRVINREVAPRAGEQSDVETGYADAQDNRVVPLLRERIVRTIQTVYEPPFYARYRGERPRSVAPVHDEGATAPDEGSSAPAA